LSSQRGIALILVILVTSFLSAIGLGLAVIVVMDNLATRNLRGSVALLYAADAAIELTARDLAQLPDWNLALSGTVRSLVTDGEPSGVRLIPGGGEVDLTVMTNQLNCGQATGCTEAEMDASTVERPWGVNNARWQLYAYGPEGSFVHFARPSASYLALWVADDAREGDNDPRADAGDEAPGHGVLRVRAEAFGPFGTRRALEAELVRSCLTGTGPFCPTGIRVQSWQELRQNVP
jgi:hypothetical protein